MMVYRTLLAAIVFSIVGSGIFASMTSAGGLKRSYGYNGLQQGYVVAESRHGNGTIKGQVRQTRLGPQVRLPGGTWEYCRRSCSETLRVETVDIWEDRVDGKVGLSQECGIFGCLEIVYPR